MEGSSSRFERSTTQNMNGIAWEYHGNQRSQFRNLGFTLPFRFPSEGHPKIPKECRHPSGSPSNK
jgi:hypothetical protein